MLYVLKLESRQTGFTLIELLVVVGILGVLLAITIVALNPAKHFADTRNAQRTAGVSTILDAIYEYEASNTGKLPPTLAGVTTTAKSIAAPASGTLLNPCADLAPTYMADLPIDPTTGTVTAGTSPCAATTYSSGFMIAINAAGNRYTVSAPAAENGATISLTR